MKIKTTLFVVCMLLSLLPLLVLGNVINDMHNKEVRQTIEDQLNNVTTTQVEMINTFFNEQDINMTILSDYDMLHELLRESNNGNKVFSSSFRSYIESLLREHSTMRSYLESITVVDRSYRVVACSKPTKPDEISILGDIEIIKDLGRDVRFSPIVKAGMMGNDTDELIAVKAIYEGDSLQGYIIEELNLSYFDNIRSSIHMMASGTIYISDGKGRLISGGSQGDNRNGFLLAEDERDGFPQAWEQRPVVDGVGMIEYSIGGAKYLTSYSGFAQSDWTILATINIDEVSKTHQQYNRVIWTAVMLALVMLVFVNMVISRKLTEPVERMVKVFDDIRETNDYSIRVEKIKNNELGRIAKGINKLLEDTEITIQYQAESLRFLKNKSERDPLTNVFNKDAIVDILSMKIDSARVNKLTLACALVDIDDFKDYNTNYGHQGGDVVIRFVASVMQEISGDMTGRIGGDEFIMGLDCVSHKDEVAVWMDILRSRLHAGVDIDGSGELVPIRCSIGVSLLSSAVEPTYEMMAALADEAMYSVKNAAKDGYAICIKRGEIL